MKFFIILLGHGPYHKYGPRNFSLFVSSKVLFSPGSGSASVWFSKARTWIQFRTQLKVLVLPRHWCKLKWASSFAAKIKIWRFLCQKSLGPLKISLEMAHKVICPQKTISRIFKISGTLIVIKAFCCCLRRKNNRFHFSNLVAGGVRPAPQPNHPGAGEGDAEVPRGPLHGLRVQPDAEQGHAAPREEPEAVEPHAGPARDRDSHAGRSVQSLSYKGRLIIVLWRPENPGDVPGEIYQHTLSSKFAYPNRLVTINQSI